MEQLKEICTFLEQLSDICPSADIKEHVVISGSEGNRTQEQKLGLLLRSDKSNKQGKQR
jgi:hypothetical protein